MKKYVLLLLMLAVAVYYNVFIAVHQKTRTLRIGIECGHVPYNWEDTSPSPNNFPLANETGSYVDGYDAHIAALVADKLDANPVFIKIPFDNLIDALNKQDIDAIFSGMVDTFERKKVISFTIPYEDRKVEYAVLVNTNSRYAHAKSLSDLAGARIIAQKDSRFDTVIDQIQGVQHLPPLDTYAAIIKEIADLRADATVLNADTAQTYARGHNNLKAILFPQGEGFVLEFTGLCAGVRKNDHELLEEMNEIIDSISMKERQKIMDRVTARAVSNF